MKLKYDMVLENEVPIYYPHLRDTFDTKRVFVIGYGSLLYASGWRRRNMLHVVKERHLTECTVEGFKRGPFGLINKDHYPTSYYGVVPDKNSFINGTLVEIKDLFDWEGLMHTECILGFCRPEWYNYRVVDVTNQVRGVELPKRAVVHMVVNEPYNEVLSQIATPAPGYYERVYRGVMRSRSKEFQQTFFATGGKDMEAIGIMQTWCLDRTTAKIAAAKRRSKRRSKLT